jgi:hypothetical protein
MRIIKAGGYWDASRREFILPRQQSAALNHIFTGVYVEVKCASACRIWFF